MIHLNLKLRKIGSIFFSIIFGFFLMFYSYNKFTDDQIEVIKDHFMKADYLYIYISMIIAILGNVSRAYRWKYTLGYLGYKTSFGTNFMSLSIGYLMNMTIPRSGEVVRAILIKKYNDIPFNKGFGTILAERIVDSLILLFLVLLAFFLQFDIVKTFFFDKIPFQQIIWILIGTIVFFFIVFYFYSYSNIRQVLQIKEKLLEVKEGVFSIVKMEHKKAFLAHTIFIWVSYVIMFYVTIFAIPEISTISFSSVLTSFIVGSITIAITSNGFGSYPVLMAQILFFYQVPETAAVAFGWIVWISQMILLIVLGFLSLILLPFFNKKKSRLS